MDQGRHVRLCRRRVNLKKSDVVKYLRADLPGKASPSMVQKCVAGLPEVSPGSSIVPLLRQQVSYFPKWIPAVIAGMFIMLFLNREQMPVFHLIMWSGGMLQGAAGLFGVHFVAADWNGMRELEYSCKYQYGQIVLSRILLCCVCLSVMGLGVNGLFLLQFGRTEVFWNVLLFFPLVAGAACALFLMELFRGKSDMIPLASLIAISFLVQLFLMRLEGHLEKSGVAVVVLFILLAVSAVVQGWRVIGRRFTYEAYNM